MIIYNKSTIFLYAILLPLLWLCHRGVAQQRRAHRLQKNFETFPITYKLNTLKTIKRCYFCRVTNVYVVFL